MRAITYFALLLAFSTGNRLLAQDAASRIDVGDSVQIVMTGELAKTFAQPEEAPRLAQEPPVPIYRSGLVIDKPAPNTLTLRYKAVVERESANDQMVTMTATIDAAKLQLKSHLATKVVTKNGVTLKSSVRSDRYTYAVHLSGLKGVKLDAYELAR